MAISCRVPDNEGSFAILNLTNAGTGNLGKIQVDELVVKSHIFIIHGKNPNTIICREYPLLYLARRPYLPNPSTGLALGPAAVLEPGRSCRTTDKGARRRGHGS